MKTFKLIVKADVTSCACLRVKKEGSDFAGFQCGIDLSEGDIYWRANSPHVYGSSFIELVENICEWHELVSPGTFGRVESFIVCDDTQALCTCCNSMDDYYAEFNKQIVKTRKAFEKVKDSALRGLKYNPKLNVYEGEIQVLNRRRF